jgi:hypothetical protein
MADKTEKGQMNESITNREEKTKTRRRKPRVEKTADEEGKSAAAVNEPIDANEEEQTLEGMEESASETNQVSEDYQEQLTSLDLLWRHTFRELDEWAKRADFRDEVFLKKAMNLSESIDRNQENLKVVTERFYKEFAAWERTTREEFLMSTTYLQHFFPKTSYEEINEQIDNVQKRTLSFVGKPCQVISNIQAVEQYLTTIEQYIAIRKKGRDQYIKTVKKAANLIYEGQKGFVDLFARQFKGFMFTFNKYLEKTDQLTKS